MPPEKPVTSADGVEATDLAKAFQELSKGERTATVLENQLSAMEAKIEALLAEAEKDQRDAQANRKGKSSADEKDAEAGAIKEDVEQKPKQEE